MSFVRWPGGHDAVRAHRGVASARDPKRQALSRPPVTGRTHQIRHTSLRATAYRWRPGVWKARRPKRPRTSVPGTRGVDSPSAPRRRAHVPAPLGLSSPRTCARSAHGSRSTPLLEEAGLASTVAASLSSSPRRPAPEDTVIIASSRSSTTPWCTSRHEPQPPPWRATRDRLLLLRAESSGEIEAGNSSSGRWCTATSKVRKDALADHPLAITDRHRQPEPQECGRSKRCLPEALTVFIMPPSSIRSAKARRSRNRDRRASASCGCATPRSRWPRRRVRLRGRERRRQIDKTVKEIAEIVRRR